MPFMEQDAIAKVAAGLTPLEDVMPWSRSKGYRVYPLQRLQQASSSGIHVLSLLRQSRCAQSFETTPERFPEGAVLPICFRLSRTNVLVTARGEGRYCLPGVASELNYPAPGEG